MKIIHLSESERSHLNVVSDYVRDWCARNQWAVGIGEMAAGAALVAVGIKIGHISLGADVVGIDCGGFNTEAITASGIGGCAGATAASILGNIGVVACGTGVGVPAAILAAGGAAIFAAAGYSVGDAVHNFLNPGVDLSQMFTGGSMLSVGLALLIDGARRFIADESLKAVFSHVRDGIVYLAEVAATVVVDSWERLKDWAHSHAQSSSRTEVIGSAVTGAAGAAVGTAIGSAVGAGAVTVLGSHALGGIALSLGLVAAPLWPVLAGGAAGVALGYGAWRWCRR